MSGMAMRNRALIAAMAGFALDGFDMLMLGFMLPAMSADLHLSLTQGGMLVTWTLLGGAIGGSAFGILADYIGRARVLSLSIIVFSVFSILSAFSTGFYDLFLYRFCAGLGMGCEFGVGMVLATEAFPAAMRPRIASYVGLSWQLGAVMAALLTPALLPSIGWRGMFVVGGIPALAALMIRLTVRDSHEFAEIKSAPRTEAPLAGLWNSPQRRRSSLAIFLMTSIQNFGYYGIMIWLPSYLTRERGQTMQHSGLIAMSVGVGMIFGVFIFGRVSERVGYRVAFAFYQICAAAVVFVYPMASSQTAMMLIGVIAGIFVNGMMGGYGELIPRFYPAAIRSTAQNVLWSAGRACGGLAPLIIGYAATRIGFGASLAMMACIYLIDLVITLGLLPAPNSVQATAGLAEPEGLGARS